jgi:hypothetical protein
MVADPVAAHCVDVAPDAVWIGAGYPLDCVYTGRTCRALGCFWRRFHALSPDQFRRKPVQVELL